MYKVITAKFTDIPVIRNLTFRVWPQTYADILTKEQIDYMLDMMYSVDSLKKQMNEGSRFIIVHESDEPVGFASFQEIKPHTWKLHKIYVLQTQQGKGTGKYIIDYIINEIKKNGGTSLELQVNRDNKAKGFYEKLGFAEREFINLDIGKGFFMRDYIMEKKL